jgi:hypothetical protein
MGQTRRTKLAHPLHKIGDLLAANAQQAENPTRIGFLPIELPSGYFIASESTRPTQPFGGRTFGMNAMVRARSTTSESPYLPGLIQFGPYIASGTLVSYDHGDTNWACL